VQALTYNTKVNMQQLLHHSNPESLSASYFYQAQLGQKGERKTIAKLQSGLELF
jgi:hypothetical protein